MLKIQDALCSFCYLYRQNITEVNSKCFCLNFRISLLYPSTTSTIYIISYNSAKINPRRIFYSWNTPTGECARVIADLAKLASPQGNQKLPVAFISGDGQAGLPFSSGNLSTPCKRSHLSLLLLPPLKPMLRMPVDRSNQTIRILYFPECMVRIEGETPFVSYLILFNKEVDITGFQDNRLQTQAYVCRYTFTIEILALRMFHHARFIDNR